MLTDEEYAPPTAKPEQPSGASASYTRSQRETKVSTLVQDSWTAKAQADEGQCQHRCKRNHGKIKLDITSGQNQPSLGIMHQIRWAGRLEIDILWG